jgi:hypothetical protein
MIGVLLAALPPALAAAAIARLAPRRSRLTVIAAAAGLSIGTTSVIWGALFFGGVRPRALLMAIDVASWLFISAAVLLAARRLSEVPPGLLTSDKEVGIPTRYLNRAAVITLLVATLAIAIVSFVSASSVFPHGEWDAWAQWNLRARFFFRGFESGEWRNAFDASLAWSHADYPPLVPLSVARAWLFLSSDTTAVPTILSAAFAGATVATAGLGVARIRGVSYGCLAAGVILVCPSFVRYAAAQCADIPLGLYMLSAFVLWAMADEPQGRFWLALAGLSGGLAAWTKNEGIPFLAVFVVLVAVERLRKRGRDGLRDVAAVVAGAAPVVVLILCFKQSLAPPSYFVAEQSAQQALQRLADVERIRLVFGEVARELWLAGARHVGVIVFLAFFVAVRGIDRQAPAGAKAGTLAMIAMMAIYLVAYLITPKDLAWQLKTSLDRLVVQVVPTLAWSIVTIAK